MKVFENPPPAKKARTQPEEPFAHELHPPSQTPSADSELNRYNSPEGAVELWHVVRCDFDPTHVKYAEVPLLRTNVPPSPHQSPPYHLDDIERDFPSTGPELAIIKLKELLDQGKHPKYSLDKGSGPKSALDKPKRWLIDAYVVETFTTRRAANDFLWRTFCDSQVLQQYDSIGVGMQGFTGCLKIEGKQKENLDVITCWWVENPYLSWNAANIVRRIHTDVTIKYFGNGSAPVTVHKDSVHRAQDTKVIISDQRTHTLTQALVRVAIGDSIDGTLLACEMSASAPELPTLTSSKLSAASPATSVPGPSSSGPTPDTAPVVLATSVPIYTRSVSSPPPAAGTAFPTKISGGEKPNKVVPRAPEGIAHIVMSDMAFNLVETLLGVMLKLSEQTHLHRARPAFEYALDKFNKDSDTRISFRPIPEFGGPKDIFQTICLVDDSVTEPDAESPLLCGFLDTLSSRGITLLSLDVLPTKYKSGGPTPAMESLVPISRPTARLHDSGLLIPAQLLLTKNDVLYMTQRRSLDLYRDNLLLGRHGLQVPAETLPKGVFAGIPFPAMELYGSLPPPPTKGVSVATVEAEADRRKNKERSAFLTTLTERDIGFLRETCKKMNLPTNGRKDALLHRIKGAVMMGAPYGP